jgi:hypothetical protein
MPLMFSKTIKLDVPADQTTKIIRQKIPTPGSWGCRNVAGL